MLHALRAELAYFKGYLFGGLGIAAGVAVIITVVFYAVGDDGPPTHAADGIRGMFMILAPMIVGFIAQALRSEEKRPRLLLTGPLTPRQLAGVSILLPVVLFGVGIIASGLAFTVSFLITGRIELESLHIAGFVGGQLFAYTQMGLLIQESSAARRQGRFRSAVAGWFGFVVAVILIAALYFLVAKQFLAWGHLILAHLAVAIIAMVVTMELYARRTDFTR